MSKHNYKLILLLACSISAAGTAVAQTAGSKPAVTPSHSEFVQLTNPKDGRDPFFPESPRMFAGQMPAQSTNVVSATQAPSLTDLKVPGVSGTPGHLLAIINNHTFAAGEDGEVLTASGRILLHCVEVHPDYVIVQVGGKIHRINVEISKE